MEVELTIFLICLDAAAELQVYLGGVSDSEAIRWMDILHGK